MDLKKLGFNNYYIGGGKEDFDGIYFFKKKFSESISVNALSSRVIHSYNNYQKALHNASIKNYLNGDNFFPPFK